MLPDSYRSEATLWFSLKGVSDLSQAFSPCIFGSFSEPFQGEAQRCSARRLFGQAGERRRGRSSL